MKRQRGGAASAASGLQGRYRVCLTMERRVDELDRFFASKKSLGGSGRKPASKGKGRKVGIKFRDAEVDSEFMDVGVNDGAPSKRMQEIMRRFGEIFRQILKHQWAGPFMDPVDVEGLQLHDYYKVMLLLT
ncbi:hypothetical protein J5N97_012743 [Dioscorea zingiberensis]|uniref:Uncharacterized protein n=1 Tax=Dioscorea zingiberensis TaxID=325984 RepID=A0A9D5HI31_9LILI|nr:hypothetical protein J5N97_012743 [Dioscorea zingiberensis]